MAGEGEQPLTGAGIPYLRRISGGGEPSAIRTEHHTPHPAGMGGKGRQLFAGTGIPHSRRVWPTSPAVMASLVPSGLNATAHAPPVRPERVSNRSPVSASHTRAVWSLAVASRVPSGL